MGIGYPAVPPQQHGIKFDSTLFLFTISLLPKIEGEGGMVSKDLLNGLLLQFTCCFQRVTCLPAFLKLSQRSLDWPAATLNPFSIPGAQINLQLQDRDWSYLVLEAKVGLGGHVQARRQDLEGPVLGRRERSGEVC